MGPVRRIPVRCSSCIIWVSGTDKIVCNCLITIVYRETVCGRILKKPIRVVFNNDHVELDAKVVNGSTTVERQHTRSRVLADSVIGQEILIYQFRNPNEATSERRERECLLTRQCKLDMAFSLFQRPSFRGHPKGLPALHCTCLDRPRLPERC